MQRIELSHVSLGQFFAIEHHCLYSMAPGEGAKLVDKVRTLAKPCCLCYSHPCKAGSLLVIYSVDAVDNRLNSGCGS